MLTPDYLAGCAAQVEELYSKLNEQITADICRRIVLNGEVTNMAEWQIKQLQECGKLMEDITADIAKATPYTESEIKTMFKDAGIASVRFDAQPLLDAGMKVETGMSKPMMNVLEANLRKTQGEMLNLTMTTASNGQTDFINAMNEAVMMVESGAFDYQTAIRRAVDQCSKIGAKVSYDSGSQMSLESAARMNILTAVNQTAARITEMNAERLGCEYYETSAHAGARLEHQEWQGRVFKIEGADGDYENFFDATGYGEVTGLCGVNCRHSFFPFFPGVSKRAYTDAQLEAYESKTVKYNGEEMSEYEATQLQRRYERAVRESKRRLNALEESISSCDDKKITQELKKSYQQAKQTYDERRYRLNDMCKQTGLKRDYLRTKAAVPSKPTLNMKTVARGKIDTTAVSRDLGKAIGREMNMALRNAPGRIQNVWNAFADKLKAVTYTGKRKDGTCFDPKAGNVFLNLFEDIKRMCEERLAVPFHEYAHMIDYLAANGRYMSHAYKNGLFEKTIQKELNDKYDAFYDKKLKEYIKNFEATTREQAYAAARRGLISADEVEGYIASKLKDGPEKWFEPKPKDLISEMWQEMVEANGIKNTAAIGDLMSGTYARRFGLDFKEVFEFDHEFKYWLEGSSNISCEAFAEFFAASVVDTEQIVYLQAVMPDSYNVFIDILEAMIP